LYREYNSSRTGTRNPALSEEISGPSMLQTQESVKSESSSATQEYGDGLTAGFAAGFPALSHDITNAIAKKIRINFGFILPPLLEP
jgi:hypothetical protein